MAWLASIMWILGLLPMVLAGMDEIRWTMGSTEVSLRNLVEGIISAVLVQPVVVEQARADKEIGCRAEHRHRASIGEHAFTTLQGQSFRTADLRGQVVVEVGQGLAPGAAEP